MEILVVTWNYPPRRGGIENFIGSLCEELRKKHYVPVITARTRIVGFTENQVYRARLPGLLGFAVYVLWRGAILLARNRGITVVFGGSALATPLVLLLARVFGRRAVVQAHGLDIIHSKFLYQQICVRWLKCCDYIVTNSRYTATLAEAKGVLPERIAVIPPGVDLDRFSEPLDVDAVKQNWGVKDRKIILFVGRLAKRKGVKEFIENSLVRIAREIPEVCFLVIGERPAESLVHSEDTVTDIRATISMSKVEKHVRLLGSLSDDDLIKMYQICDVVVLPALDVENDVEGFGIVALEAAAAGKPVVATRVGGIPDAVEDGQSGILIEPGDYTSLSQVITSLLKDRESSCSKGRYGRYRVKREFLWRRLAARYQGVFDRAPL